MFLIEGAFTGNKQISKNDWIFWFFHIFSCSNSIINFNPQKISNPPLRRSTQKNSPWDVYKTCPRNFLSRLIPLRLILWSKGFRGNRKLGRDQCNCSWQVHEKKRIKTSRIVRETSRDGIKKKVPYEFTWKEFTLMLADEIILTKSGWVNKHFEKLQIPNFHNPSIPGNVGW